MNCTCGDADTLNALAAGKRPPRACPVHNAVRPANRARPGSNASAAAPVTLGQLVAALDLSSLRPGRPNNTLDNVRTTARVSNLVTSPTPGVPALAVPSFSPAPSPLLDAVDWIDDLDTLTVIPFEVEADNAADVVAPAALKPESTLTITDQELTDLPIVAHHAAIHKKHLAHNPTLQRMIDTFLSNGLLVRLHERIIAAMTAGAGTVGMFEGTIGQTVREAIAAAQNAVPELAVGPVTVVLSPNDHAALDLEGLRVSEWPARIISVPGVPDGVGFAGRLKSAVQVRTTEVEIELGHINAQFIQNKITARGEFGAFAFVGIPDALISFETQEDEQS